MIYYIEDSNGRKGHPTKKADMIHRLLKNGRAKIRRRGKDWMLIKIDKIIDPEKTIPSKFVIGLDPGYLNIGFAVFKVTSKIEKILEGEAELRTSDVTSNMTDRKMYRNARRYYRRKNVKRKYNACKFRKPIWKNRKKHEFQPTHTHLIHSHLNVLLKIFELIPYTESEIVVEYAKFDTHKLVNPNVSGIDYQFGPQYGFENVKNYVRFRDSYTCQACKKNKDLIIESHHIIPRSQGGPDTPENLICLCTPCHDKIQNGRLKCPKQKPSVFKSSGVLNSVMKRIYETVSGSITNTSKTFGYVTDAYRKHFKLAKTHSGDASIIAFCEEEKVKPEILQVIETNIGHMNLRQFRRHVRYWVHAYQDRKYYSGGTCVAWNRRTREGQDKKKPSLEEYQQVYGYDRLVVKPGAKVSRRSNTQVLFRPGDKLRLNVGGKTVYDTCVGWASTQNKVNTINNGMVPKRTVTKIASNGGLTII